MKVKDLISALQECDQEKAVFVWREGDIQAPLQIDELSDRVDINIALPGGDIVEFMREHFQLINIGGK